MEFKTMPVYPQDVQDRTITGFAAVTGNIDQGQDRILSGAFTKTLNDGRKRYPHLWQHDFKAPPIATIVDIQEVKRAALPAEVLADYPDATGGLQVSRKYLETPRADEIFQGIIAGAIQGMSFGFEVPKGKSQLVKVEDATVRNLMEIKLIETSDTPFPMNPAARAQKGAVLYNLLGALDEVDDLATIMALGQSLTPEQLSMCQQCITLCLSLLQSAAQADQLESMLGTMSAPVTALRKAIAGATWLHTPAELVVNASMLGHALKAANPALFKQDGLPTELIAQLQTKQGRMISAANEAKIRTVMDAIEQSLETLEALLGTAEPLADEESGKALTDAGTLLALLDLTEAEFQ